MKEVPKCWRRQNPDCCQTKYAKPSGECEDFKVIKGQRWKCDEEHQERNEWAGPVTGEGFEIELEYNFPHDLLIADPKLTIFQIHSYVANECPPGWQTGKPLLMVNFRRYDSAIDGGVGLHDKHVFMEAWFRNPIDHQDEKNKQDWKPAIIQNRNCGVVAGLKKLSLKCKVCREEKGTKVTLTLSGDLTAEKKFKLNLGCDTQPAIELYPKFGVYRSDEEARRNDIEGFLNGFRPDQNVKIKLVCCKFCEDSSQDKSVGKGKTPEN